MINEWQLSNFKSIREIPHLRFAPLTVICGPNSSGKSTIIQSILMIAQTLDSPNIRRPLILNGELVRLGYLDDILHHGLNSNSISIQCKLQWQPISTHLKKDAPSSGISLSLLFEKPEGSDKQASRVNLVRSVLQVDEQEIRVEVAIEYDLLFDIDKNNFEISPELKEDIRLGKYNYSYEIRPSDEQRELIHRDAQFFNNRCSIRHFLPNNTLELYDQEAEQLNSLLGEINNVIHASYGEPSEQLVGISIKSPMGQLLKANLISAINEASRGSTDKTEQDLAFLRNMLENAKSMGDWLYEARKRLRFNSIAKSRFRRGLTLSSSMGRRDTKTQSKRVGVKQSQINLDIIRTSDKIVDFFTNGIKYLGPLRDDPKMIFSLPPIPDMKDVGMKGEYTAAVLERFGKDILVECPLPPENERFIQKTQQMALIDAVNLWLKHMNLVKNVITTDYGKMGVGLTVQANEGDMEFDLTNVGVGVSQVLPMLTMCLLTPVDGTVLIEQPELHLHPKVQGILGDFFLGIATRGTQCILETHSDRLINRIRRRIAEDLEDKIFKLTRIYMVEMENSETKILQVEPNEYGAITRWPKGFFDEGPDESSKIIAAATKKRDARVKK